MAPGVRSSFHLDFQLLGVEWVGPSRLRLFSNAGAPLGGLVAGSRRGPSMGKASKAARAPKNRRRPWTTTPFPYNKYGAIAASRSTVQIPSFPELV